MKKLVGIFIMTLLMTSALQAVGTINALEEKKIILSQLAGEELSMIYHQRSELLDNCNIHNVETESQFTTYVKIDDLDNFIMEMMELYHVPGVSVSLVKDGALILARSYGFANITKSTLVSDTTLFYLASVSKTITAVAMMQLYEDGLFDMNDSINDYLPFEVIHPEFPSVDITFHMLLTHSSGIIEDQNFIQLYNGDSPNPLGEWLEDYLTPGGQHYDPDRNYGSEPGTRRVYSNVAVGLVGYLVEVISEIPFDEYCDINIFEPLGMNETSWFLSDLDIDNIAVPYIWNGDEHEPQPHWGRDYYPASTLRTSVLHLSNFLVMMINKGEYNSNQILEENTVDYMLSSQLSFNKRQGIIWSLLNVFGRNLWHHYGGLPGLTTQISYYPETNNGVIVLTNGDYNAFIDIATDTLYDFLESPSAPDIEGETNGKAKTEYDYTFSSIDPDDDDIAEFIVNWGDGTGNETIKGPFVSGAKATASHTYNSRGNFIITAKAKDINHLIGTEGILEVSMPKTKSIRDFNPLISRLIERFPILELLI